MDIEAFRCGLINALEELKKLLMTMACLALRQDCSGRDVESGKQGGGAMANVVVGHSFDVSKSHGQHGLGPVEGLDLRILINGEHDRMIRRFQIEPHDIAYFFNEERIAGELEVLAPVRVNGERPEDAMNR